jgi:gluconolactonase
MRALLLLTVLLAAPAALIAAPTYEVPPPTGSRIIDPGAKFELLYTRSANIKGGLTEGPAVAPDGSIYFTDLPFGDDKGLIVRFDPKTKQCSVFTDDSGKANGLMFDAKGFLIACEGSDQGGRRVSRWNVKTKERTTLADRFEGKRFNAPNDCCIDRKGRIYFADPRYLGFEPRELEHRAVYRIDPDGTVIEISHEMEKPNGVALSPDGKTLYVADHNNGQDRIDLSVPAQKGAMKIYAFPLGSDGKVNGARRTLQDYGTENGVDGMTVDVQGNLYLALRSLSRPGIQVIDPQGKELAFIPTGPSQPGTTTPVGIPSNVDFGIGTESTTLYVTTDVSLYRIRCKIPGWHIPWEK